MSLSILTSTSHFGVINLSRRTLLDVSNRVLKSPVAEFLLEKSLNQTLDAKRVEVIDWSREHLIMRCSITVDGYEPVKVICKIGFEGAIQRITKEADLYEQKLGPILGRFAPDYYGFYECTSGKRPACCLLLQDCGTPLVKSFKETSWKFRYVLLVIAQSRSLTSELPQTQARAARESSS